MKKIFDRKSNIPYVKHTQHYCEGLMFSPGTNIIYDISSESWKIVSSRNHSEVIQNHIKYCSYCGEKLKTCTKIDAVFDFIEQFF